MASEKETGGSDGLNARAIGATLAETGPGIPDDAVMAGELRPTDFDAAAVDLSARALARQGWSQASGGGVDDAEAEAEVEAHPS